MIKMIWRIQRNFIQIFKLQIRKRKRITIHGDKETTPKTSGILVQIKDFFSNKSDLQDCGGKLKLKRKAINLGMKEGRTEKEGEILT